MVTMSSTSRDGDAAALLAEYGRADQVIEQQEFDWGILATITFPANLHRPARTTHLVFGGRREPQAREIPGVCRPGRRADHDGPRA